MFILTCLIKKNKLKAYSSGRQLVFILKTLGASLKLYYINNFRKIQICYSRIVSAARARPYLVTGSEVHNVGAGPCITFFQFLNIQVKVVTTRFANCHSRGVHSRSVMSSQQSSFVCVQYLIQLEYALLYLEVVDDSF